MGRFSIIKKQELEGKDERIGVKKHREGKRCLLYPGNFVFKQEIYKRTHTHICARDVNMIHENVIIS